MSDRFTDAKLAYGFDHDCFEVRSVTSYWVKCVSCGARTDEPLDIYRAQKWTYSHKRSECANR